MSNINDDNNDIDASGSLVAGLAKRQLTVAQKLAVGALVLVLALSFIWLGGRSAHERDDKAPDLAVSTNVKAFRAAPIVLPPPPAPSPPPPEPALPMPTGNGVTIPALRSEPSPAESPIFAYAAGSNAPRNETSPTQQDGRAAEDGAQNDASSTGGENALSSQLKPTVLQSHMAALLPHPDMTITQGTIIPCILQTAIDTNLPGFVKCVLPQDIRGTTGNVVLLDRGTIVIGEIQKGLQQGDGRVFVLWDRAETPSHAVVALGSPGSDELGRAGLSGKVNTHFWKRFGGTILLSVVQGAFQAGTALAGNSGGGGGDGMTSNNFQSSGEQPANTALRASIDIPPTLEKNQGDTVSIFVAQDLDFSGIYGLAYAPRQPADTMIAPVARCGRSGKCLERRR